jgi:hypothetical protein
MEDDKLSGRVVIDTILTNMRQQVEALRYSKIVPAAHHERLPPRRRSARFGPSSPTRSRPRPCEALQEGSMS